MTKPSLRLTVVLMALTSPLLLAQQASTPAAAAKEPAFKAHVLTVPELDALLAKPDQVLLIDVRRPDEVSSIGGFPVYLSVQASDLEKSLAWIPRDRTLPEPRHRHVESITSSVNSNAACATSTGQMRPLFRYQ